MHGVPGANDVRIRLDPGVMGQSNLSQTRNEQSTEQRPDEHETTLRKEQIRWANRHLKSILQPEQSKLTETAPQCRAATMLEHEFWLLSETTTGEPDWSSGAPSPADVVLPDEIVLYLADTLQWVPTINPANPDDWRGFGLNYHGPTVIQAAGARQLARILRHWGALFGEGPAHLELRGTYQWREGEAVEAGRYERISAARDNLIRDLLALAALADRVEQGRAYLLHRGI
jgi:hypothetical protein